MVLLMRFYRVVSSQSPMTFFLFFFSGVEVAILPWWGCGDLVFEWPDDVFFDW